jgi:hypothetical protein
LGEHRNLRFADDVARTVATRDRLLLRHFMPSLQSVNLLGATRKEAAI